MIKDIADFHSAQIESDRKICNLLYKIITESLPKAESKVWHAHPVWFIDGNPIVGYSSLKDCIRLMFWSGMSFDEDELKPGTGKFKDASKRYNDISQIDEDNLKRWLSKSENIQWDYKNIYKSKGVLKRLNNEPLS